MSADVPPISSVMTLLMRVSFVVQIAPSTPPTGPDSSRFTGFSCADSAEATPPKDCMRCTFARYPCSVSVF